jgi:hypothetical protein
VKLLSNRQFITVCLFAFIQLAVAGCCTKRYCIGIEDLHQIDFENFAVADVDTVMVKQFRPNTGFTMAVDSFVSVSPYLRATDTLQTVNLSRHITIDFDYQVILVSSGQIFTLSDFVAKKEKCNSGPFCIDNYMALVSYKLNGRVQSDYNLRIRN